MSECAVTKPFVGTAPEAIEKKEVCLSPSEFRILKQVTVKYNFLDKTMIDMLDYEGLVLLLRDKLQVDSEKEIWDHEKVKEIVGDSIAKFIKHLKYNPDGPAGSNELLNNFNIDDTLSSYTIRAAVIYSKRFLHVPFQMIDFESQKTELAKLDFIEASKKYDCMGVVLNSDVSSGPGKHWFALYVDFKKNPLTIEYFNSSGRPPYPEIIDWVENVRSDLLKKNVQVGLKVVATQRIQESKTECGVFSLIFIIGRLEGKPTEYFTAKNVNDEYMLKYRNILFAK